MNPSYQDPLCLWGTYSLRDISIIPQLPDSEWPMQQGGLPGGDEDGRDGGMSMLRKQDELQG